MTLSGYFVLNFLFTLICVASCLPCNFRK